MNRGIAMSKISEAIHRLADLYEYGHAEAAMDPAGFLDQVTGEIKALRDPDTLLGRMTLGGPHG